MDSATYAAFSDEFLKIAAYKEAGLFSRMGDAVAEGAQRLGRKVKSINEARKRSNAEWANQYENLQREAWNNNEMARVRAAEGIADVGNKVLRGVKSDRRLVVDTHRGRKAYNRMLEREKKWKRTQELRAQAAKEREVARQQEKHLPIPHRGQSAKPAEPAPTPAQQYAANVAESQRRMDADFARTMERTGVSDAYRRVGKALTPQNPTEQARHNEIMQHAVGNRFLTTRIPTTTLQPQIQ